MQTTEKILGLMMGVPTLGRPTNVQWAFALASLHPPINYTVQSAIIWGQEVADARNHLAEQAIKANAKYLFFLGDDTEPPGHALKQLIYRMEHNPEIGVCGGIYCAKSDPPFPLVFRGNGAGSYWDWRLGEFFEVTGLGMDATLIRVDLLKQLSPPWFKTIREDGFLDARAQVESWTEDLWFCDRILEETKYEIFADSMVMCKHWQHLGGSRWRDYTLRSDSLPMRRAHVETLPDAKQILDLGCGPQHWDFGAEGQVTRVDIREECSPDYRCDVRQLPFGDEAFDVVFSSHTLEHFARGETEAILREWLRVLKPGGQIRLIIPNIGWAARQIAAGVIDGNVLNVLYGSQEYDQNFHKCGFTPETLAALLETLGVTVGAVNESGYNIILEGTKHGIPGNHHGQ